MTIAASMKKQTAVTIGTKNVTCKLSSTASWIKVISGGATAIPTSPKAICNPISPRPTEVSLVAITQAVQIKQRAAVANISPRDLKLDMKNMINIYTSTHFLSCSFIFGVIQKSEIQDKSTTSCWCDTRAFLEALIHTWILNTSKKLYWDLCYMFHT